ncbi:hypothetical protein I4U23_016348 [Adineta vaga]|nr:hypothetical protein I4U23_016348 [Adineta vaga]
MASKKSKVDQLTEKTGAMALNHTNATSSQTAHYYIDRKESDTISFARLEKGLLLFINVYETSKSTLATEMLFWDHRLCANVIITGTCSKPSDQCRSEHQTSYRQMNLCPHWYINNRCTLGTKCRNSHQLEAIPNEHRNIRTETESDVFKLIRFIRNFAGHYNETVIDDRQELYKDILVIMVHLVHALSRKNPQSIKHLHLFLEKTTINQMIAEEDLLRELEKPFSVPEVFFDLRLNYSANWYRPTGNKRDVDFNQLSSRFVAYFNRIFVDYYQGRLKSRGAKAAWS